MSPRRTRIARTSRSRPARRARLLTRRAKLNAARRPRRGVLLLVVLSLLVLFLMVGTAFVITAKQSEKAAKSSMKGAVRVAAEAAQADLLDEVLMQLVRDTNNPHSSLRFHSLLGDMYGNEGLKGVIDSTTPPNWAGGVANPTGGQMLEFQLQLNDPVDTTKQNLKDFYGNNRDAAGNFIGLSNNDNAYNGQVLTFHSGAAKGRSTRIVGFIPPNTFRVMNFQLEDGTLISNPGNQLANARVLINGRPFNGAGVGLNVWADPDGPKLNAAEELVTGSGQFYPMALLPNAKFQLASSKINLPGTPPPSAGVNATDPHNQFYNPLNVQNWIGRGGANESYDAVDFQNMPLAYVPAPRGGTTLQETVLADVTGALPPDLGTMVIPSWHRPELIQYWANSNDSPLKNGSDGVRSSNLAGNAMMLRRVLMRPNWLDHPNFSGSNPALAAIADTDDQTEWGQKLARMVYGPWDVDNDNDGYRDSVWIDVGLPVMAGPNGKLVKPLAAILVVDMDGRLNVNAHGTCDLAEAWPSNGSSTGLSAMTETARLADPTNVVRSDVAPHGFGFGPAEISLSPAISMESFRRLLTGGTFAGKFVPGRYGFSHAVNGMIRPGISDEFDVLTQIGLNGWPRRANVLSSFVTPPDLRARYGVGLNNLGQAIFESTLNAVMGSASDDLVYDSPYELNLSQKTAAGIQGYNGANAASDAPFSLAELERVLRAYDADSGALPGRLSLLLNDPNARLKVTTDSFDLPAPNVSLPHEMESLITTNLDYRRLPTSAAELFEIRIRAALFPGDNSKIFPLPLVANDANNVRAIVRRLIAPELANGTRLNVNRPFGNGRDDDGNGVVDEPGEFRDLNVNGAFDPGEETKVWSLIGGAAPAAALGAYADPIFPMMASEIAPLAGDPAGQVVPVDHRHLMARHLYVLALTLTAEEDFGTRTPTAEDQMLARRLAQWAVNAVDFRDPDNIMTPFEYDVNPFDGWDVDGYLGASPGGDGVLGTADDVESPDGDGKRPSTLESKYNGQVLAETIRGVVWGAERPELVMTEILAWHDRRTDDSAQEDVYPAGKQANIMKTPDLTDPDRDLDYDQLVRPRGVLFIELYNPWAPTPAANADTHDRVTAPGYDMGVNLAARASDGSPAWRIAVFKRTKGNSSTEEAIAGQWDPDHPDKDFRPYRNEYPKMDRSIYFSGNASRDSAHGTAFFNDQTQNPTPPVRPGRFLVVGSGDQTDDGVYETPIGDRKGRDPANRKAQRRIELVTKRANGQDRANSARMLDSVSDPVAAAITDPAGQYRMQAPPDDGTTLERVPGDSDLTSSVADVAIIDRVENGAGGSVRRRLSLTEPAVGYPQKFRAAEWNEAKAQYEAQGAPMAIDIPLDGPIGGEDALANQNVDWPYSYPLDEVLTEIRPDSPQGTPTDPGAFYSNLYLQRLANPLLPWNPEPGHPDHVANQPVNPYLSVDSLPANVTVFNSRGDDGGKEEDGTDANEPRPQFASVQRGATSRRHNQGTPNFVPSLWGREAPNLVRARPAKAAQDMLYTETNPRSFRRMPLQNEHDFWFNAVPLCSLGYLNRDFQSTAGTGVQRQQMPVKPFEWVTWNNRPYVSGNELMLVPRFRSSELLKQFSNAETPPANWNEYQLPPDPEPKPQPGPQQIRPYRHLENSFFYEEGSAVAPAGTPLHLYRLLEYVHSPSLFVGTETWLNPSTAAFGSLAPMANSFDVRLNYQPPFNAVAEFRDPGRVNLNTLPGKDIWDGLFHGSTKRNGTAPVRVHPGPDDDEFAASRRGYTLSNQTATLLNSDFPTMFANPFRAPDAGNLVPLPQLVRKGVDLGLLRSDDSQPTGPAPNADPLFAVVSTDPYDDTKRNPYFRYQPVTRTGSLVTGRSNVFAVWVTIGFFEVEEVPKWNSGGVDQANFNNDINLFNRVYPDGYAFGREDGVDVGNTRRLRSFYIIDRTKMAGYEPGADHNVENVVRLRRRIE